MDRKTLKAIAEATRRQQVRDKFTAKRNAERTAQKKEVARRERGGRHAR